MVVKGGSIQVISPSAEAAKGTLALDPLLNRPVQVVGCDISLNAAPDSTVAPGEWRLSRRGTALVAGAAATESPFHPGDALDTVGLEILTTEGTEIDICKYWYVPNVSGLIWQARPGEGYVQTDLTAVGGISLRHEAVLPTGVGAITQMSWLE